MAVIGAGKRGRTLARLLAISGQSVVLLDAQAGQAERAIGQIRETWLEQIAQGALSPEWAERAMERIRPVRTLESAGELDAVLEAIPDRLEAKHALLHRLEHQVDARTLLIVTTDTLAVSSIASQCRLPGRVAGLHIPYFTPGRPVIELVSGLRTDLRTIERLRLLLRSIGHELVDVQDSPGLLIDHTAQSLICESLCILDEGVADSATIDRVLREHLSHQGRGMESGPFAWLDAIGLQRMLPVLESGLSRSFGEPRLRLNDLLTRRVAAGLWGRTTGEGFYRYIDGTAVPALPAECSVSAQPHPTPTELGIPTNSSADQAPPVTWVLAGVASTRSRLEACLNQLGHASHGLLEGPRTESTPPNTFFLLAPLGEDASGMAARLNLPPEQCIALDTLLDPMAPDVRRRVAMTTICTGDDTLHAARALLTADGVPLEIIRDSNGFITQRILALLIAGACELAQRSLAAPADIDRSLCAGLGLPIGPLALADHIGPRIVLDLLETLHQSTGEARFRPVPWLRRRAALGRPLLAD